MNEFIQHMNTLPLHHEPEFPFMRHSFLADFYSTFHKTYTQLDTNKIEYSIVKNKSATLARIHRDLKAITNEIKEYTLKHVIHDLQAHYHNNEVNITILFSLFSTDEEVVESYKRYIPWIVHWFTLCYQFSEKKCHHPVALHLYLTPFEKKIPTADKVIGEINVNTGYTWHCKPHNKIVIYRQEEWFKVLIHESFHFFNFEDFKHEDEARLKECFPLRVKLEIGEAYGEFWARVLNCFYQAYFIDKERSRKTSVLKHFYRMMYIERIFTCYQAEKILNHMKLSYTDLYIKTSEAELKRRTYKEKSNVFCYYILVAVLMNEYQTTMEWCHKHNDILININESNSHLFVDYVKQICKHPVLLHNLTILGTMKYPHDTTLRMSFLDFL